MRLFSWISSSEHLHNQNLGLLSIQKSVKLRQSKLSKG